MTAKRNIVIIMCDNEVIYGPADIAPDKPAMTFSLDGAAPGDTVSLPYGQFAVDYIEGRDYADRTVRTFHLAKISQIDATSYFNDIKAGVMRVIDDELKDIAAMRPEPDETEIELNVRKANWSAAIRSLRIRLQNELTLGE